jgi:hypothetical protein
MEHIATYCEPNLLNKYQDGRYAKTKERERERERERGREKKERG